MAYDMPPADWPIAFSGEFSSGIHDGKWQTTYANGSRVHGDELQIYVDPGFRNAAGELPLADPFRSDDQGLSIVATKLRPEETARFDGHGYLSGIITTYGQFAQTYGYFEARVQIPAGRGLWPAFWRLPVEFVYPPDPPELDVFEVLGDRPSRVYLTLHSQKLLFRREVQRQLDRPDLSAQFHTYGLCWTEAKVTWYLDGAEVFSTGTPADLHKPMFLLLNLAVGGAWPGSPDARTVFPAAMRVMWVRAYHAPVPPTDARQ